MWFCFVETFGFIYILNEFEKALEKARGGGITGTNTGTWFCGRGSGAFKNFVLAKLGFFGIKAILGIFYYTYRKKPERIRLLKGI
jgi:hypothetical protein